MNNSKVDLFVVGAARSGTTSLYNYLSSHPQLFLPAVKECNYFSEVESLDYKAYESPKDGKYYHMKIIQSEEDYDSLFADCPEGLIKADVSPSYLWDLNSARRIHEYNPDAKIIMSLRNPIERAFSHYLMHFNTGHESEESFEAAIDAPKRLIWGGGNMYLEIGHYASQVERYLSYFKPEQLKVLIYEEWTKDLSKAMIELSDFIGVAPFDLESIEERHNETFHVKNVKVLNYFRSGKKKKVLDKLVNEEIKTKIKKTLFSTKTNPHELTEPTRQRLNSYFKDDVRKLESLLNLPLTEKWEIR